MCVLLSSLLYHYLSSSPEHAILDGITRPRDDKFWDHNLPPNGWRCRCTAVPVDPLDAKETPAEEAERRAAEVNTQPKQAIFRFNPGKTMKIFPPKHPYLPKGCGDCDKNLRLAYDATSEKCQACAAVALCRDKNFSNRFEEIRTDNGKVYVHTEHGKIELAENTRIATYFANKYGQEIYLLKREDKTKCADVYNKTLECTQEYKKCSSKTSVDNQIRKGALQSSHVIIETDMSNMTFEELRNVVHSRVRRCTIDDITIIIEDKDAIYKKNEIISNDFKIRQEDFK